MKLQLFCSIILPLAVVSLVTGCTPIQTYTMNDTVHPSTTGSSQVAGGAIRVAVVASDDAIFKLNGKANPPVCTFVPPDGTPTSKQAKRVAHEADATSVLVLKDYGKHVAEIVKANFETRFPQVNVTTTLTPGTADCIIQPHETFVQTDWGWKSTISLTATYAGKQHTAESSSLKEVSPYNLIWELPVAVGGYPAGLLIVEAVDASWANHNVHLSINTAWGDSCGQIVGQLAGQMVP